MDLQLVVTYSWTLNGGLDYGDSLWGTLHGDFTGQTLCVGLYMETLLLGRLYMWGLYYVDQL